MAGVALPVKHYGSVDIFLEAFSSSIMGGEWMKAVLATSRFWKLKLVG
jgi:hypothetical protein